MIVVPCWPESWLTCGGGGGGVWFLLTLESRLTTKDELPLVGAAVCEVDLGVVLLCEARSVIGESSAPRGGRNGDSLRLTSDTV